MNWELEVHLTFLELIAHNPQFITHKSPFLSRPLLFTTNSFHLTIFYPRAANELLSRMLQSYSYIYITVGLLIFIRKLLNLFF